MLLFKMRTWKKWKLEDGLYPVYPELITGDRVIEPLMVGGYQVGVVVPAPKRVPRPDYKCLQMTKSCYVLTSG